MRIGVVFPQTELGGDPGAVRAYAQAAEGLGYRHLLVYDHVVGADFVMFCELAFTDRIGPLLIPGAGHFLQWERADIFNPLLISVFS